MVFTCKTEDPFEGPIESILTDNRDGNIYKTIKIGRQWWMAENLNYISGNEWIYADDANNAKTYGRLYDWETACEVCPEGWHLASYEEWMELILFLGDRDVAGGKLKVPGTAYWNGTAVGVTNSSGFSALPCGARYSSGYYSCLHNFGYYWTSFENDTEQARYWLLSHDVPEEIRSGIHTKDYCMSVRCIRDK